MKMINQNMFIKRFFIDKIMDNVCTMKQNKNVEYKKQKPNKKMKNKLTEGYSGLFA
jgi:hypothetical protein